MPVRRGTIIGVLMATLALVGPSSAAALPSELGDRCTGDERISGQTVLVSGNGETDLTLPSGVPPESGDTITSWTVHVAPGVSPMPEKLVVFQQVSESELRKVAESELKTVSPGTNTFVTRLQVPEYARIGLYGPEGTLLCGEAEGHAALLLEGDPALGVPELYEFRPRIAAPVMATLAYGPTPGGSPEGPGSNECTRGGPRTSACPVIELKAGGVARRRAILVSVRVSSRAPVSVTGKVGWKVGRRPRVVDLGAAGKTVDPNRVARIRVPLPEAVLLRLAKLRPKRSLRARIAVTVTDKLGEETSDEFVVKLHGRRRVRTGRAARHAHHRHHKRR